VIVQLIDRAFCAHPRSVGETYPAHLSFAWRFAGLMAWGALAALMHGLFPFAFQTTASDVVRRLCARISDRPARGADADVRR
jgi:hypothetical protein